MDNNTIGMFNLNQFNKLLWRFKKIINNMNLKSTLTFI